MARENFEFDFGLAVGDHVIEVFNTWRQKAAMTASLCKTEAMLLRILGVTSPQGW